MLTPRKFKDSTASMWCKISLVIWSLAAVTFHVDGHVDNVKNTAMLQMLDAMQQLMTGDPHFDRDFYRELLTCMDTFHPNLSDSQDKAWQGIIDYWLMGGADNDPWGDFDTVYIEQNATNTMFLNMTIYEPCNYASNVAYYHDVTEFCNRMSLGSPFLWPEEYVKALGSAYSGLGMGSSFMHLSHTQLGGQQDTNSIGLIAYAIHQGALSAIPDCPTILTDLTKIPREHTSLELIDNIMNMYLTMPVVEWRDYTKTLDVPDYYLTFAGIVSTVLTMAFEPDVVDNLIPIISDYFSVPEEIVSFVMDDYLPEMRNVTNGFHLGIIKKTKFIENSFGTILKLIYAFLWQEELLTDNPLFLNETVNAKGWEMLPKVNTFLNSYITFDHFEPDFQTGNNIYPGDVWCNPVGPHAKWHLESAIGLLDLTYLGDEMYRLLSENL